MYKARHQFHIGFCYEMFKLLSASLIFPIHIFFKHTLRSTTSYANQCPEADKWHMHIAHNVYSSSAPNEISLDDKNKIALIHPIPSSSSSSLFIYQCVFSSSFYLTHSLILIHILFLQLTSFTPLLSCSLKVSVNFIHFHNLAIRWQIDIDSGAARVWNYFENHFQRDLYMLIFPILAPL